MSARGQNGTVTFDGAFVTISRTGALARMTIGKGEKRLPIGSITAVQWKKPGALVNGFIAFTVPGGIERQSKFGTQTRSAGHDENSVIVTKRQGPAFEALRAAIESGIAGSHQPVAMPARMSDADEIRKLADLHAAGVLTDEEFSAKKAQILGI